MEPGSQTQVSAPLGGLDDASVDNCLAHRTCALFKRPAHDCELNRSRNSSRNMSSSLSSESGVPHFAGAAAESATLGLKSSTLCATSSASLTLNFTLAEASLPSDKMK